MSTLMQIVICTTIGMSIATVIACALIGLLTILRVLA